LSRKNKFDKEEKPKKSLSDYIKISQWVFTIIGVLIALSSLE